MRCARCSHASTACCRAASKPGGTTRGKRRWGDGDATCAAHNLKLLRRCEATRASGRVVARRSTLVPVAQGLPRVVHSCRRSEEHTSELQSLMRISYAVFCLKKKN